MPDPLVIEKMRDADNQANANAVKDNRYESVEIHALNRA